jgi:hypothetical protein
MCLNYVQGGKCYATHQDCLLGQNGASAPNDSGTCSLHGKFDVWITHDNRALISDLGFPSEEPKQCLALGVTEQLAVEIAQKSAQELATRILTTERRCLGCGKPYWYTEHENSKVVGIGRGYLCPDCIAHETEQGFATRLGNLGYWCG